MTIRDLDPVTQHSVELDVLETLWRNGIDLAVTVPCKYIARLIVETEQDPRFTLLYPSRKEEGLGIAAGALLYNLGSRPTDGRYAPPDYLHIVVDNGAHGATGYQPTATSAGTDLVAVARGCGLAAERVDTPAALGEALDAWLARGGARLIVAVASERPAAPAPLPPYSGREIAERFGRALGCVGS